ncbi:MAG: HD-GYP domain-containing protein [Vampirovibrio sp.]|nr:HD-GYP domain-containing protein [Vampirovibrio sp.]
MIINVSTHGRSGQEQNFIQHEGILLTDENVSLSASELARDPAVNTYSPQQCDIILESLEVFHHRLLQGAPADIALSAVVREQMIAEMTTAANQIHYLTQFSVRDPFTYDHILDVAALSISLALAYGIPSHQLRDIALSAILHDLGKLLIPRSIMMKPGRLTEKEFEVMKLHPGIGYRIIREELRLSEDIARPALEHQEMFNGGGYPQNIKGSEIHLYSHIVKIADVYDALTSKRPYKEPIPSGKALQIMLSEGDKSFHPELLQAFAEMANYKTETRLALKAS